MTHKKTILLDCPSPGLIAYKDVKEAKTYNLSSFMELFLGVKVG